jgi:hypothetical protein
VSFFLILFLFSPYIQLPLELFIYQEKGGTMSHTRREFIKDIAVAGAAVSTGTLIGAEKIQAEETEPVQENARCPYFDQPMYCKGLTPDGKPMCDK